MDRQAIFIVLMLVFVLLLRVFADRWDRDRIAAYIAERGGTVVDIAWQPFGRGWFGEKGERFYEVQYTSRDGATHSATCKTSLFSGVYFTEERQLSAPRFAHNPPLHQTMEALREENLRLRQENERLRRLSS